jgi:lipoprotein-anchoring transpeptidase ErfK/SrfK
MHTNISTGVNSSFTTNGFSTTTPQGRHNVMSKMPSKHMGAGGLAGASADFTPLPGVPWTCFFAEGGYALHGTYWHNNFGVQMSRGCVNMRNEDAKWLFRWVLPESGPSDWEVRGNGTRVEVF